MSAIRRKRQRVRFSGIESDPTRNAPLLPLVVETESGLRNDADATPPTEHSPSPPPPRETLYCSLETAKVVGNTYEPIRIDRIEMSLLDPAVIRRLAVIEIQQSTIQDKNMPRSNGPNDHRLGSMDRRILCGTCRHGPEVCQGHWGVLELPVPIWHIGYIDTIGRIMRAICIFCSRILQGPSDVEVAPTQEQQYRSEEKQRFATFCPSGRRTSSVCAGCSLPQPTYLRQGIGWRLEWSKNAREQIKEYLKSIEQEKEIHDLFKWRLDEPVFQALDAWVALRAIPDEDCRIFGLDPKVSRPEWMLHTAFPVPPVAIRPSIRLTECSKARGHDDLTNKLHEIVKYAERVRTLIGDLLPTRMLGESVAIANWTCKRILTSEQLGENATPFDGWYPDAQKFANAFSESRDVRMAMENLQFHVATYLNQDIKGQSKTTQRSGAQHQCLYSRQRHKDGRVRGSLMGKRADFSARNVISPDPQLDIDEVGVPKEIALGLTFPETVNQLSRANLARRVANGPGRLDGAANILLPPGVGSNAHSAQTQRIDLSLLSAFERGALALPDGALVERYLQNGDPVAYNRQPSLHRMNMMCHRVRILPGRTFRHSPLVDTAYNADFDGDEMNLHVPQSLQARAELATIMSVEQNLLTPQSNKPIIGLMQDSLLAAYLITQPGVFLERDQVCDILAQILPDTPILPRPAILRPKPLWTGRQVVSALLPADLYLEKLVRVSEIRNDDVRASREPAYSLDSVHTVRIVGGELVSGTLCKETLGTSSKGLVQVLVNDFSPERAAKFLNQSQRVLIRWVSSHEGFSIGLSDCLPSAEASRRKHALADLAESHLLSLQKEAIDSGVPLRDLEFATNQFLSRMLELAGRVISSEVPEDNRLVVMTGSGAKGRGTNVSQIMAMLGQQTVGGARLGEQLPAFLEGEQSADARGCVRSSYTDGLNAREAFHHAQGGKEGLVATAVGTSRTGYMQRRLMKGMESHHIEADGSVRDADKRLVQSLYGGDRFDGQHVERQQVSALQWSDETIVKNIGWND